MRKQTYEKTVSKLAALTEEWGKAKIYLVGGCVRDSLLGVGVKDIDLMIDLENGPQLFCDWLEKNGKAKNFVTYPRFGTARFDIVVDGRDIPIECVMPRRETYNNGPRKPDSVEYASLKEDAQRRDFCCNALYQDVETRETLDPTEHGMDDLKNKILRTPLPAAQTFRDDPLRMLRAFRFWAVKDFQIHPDVMSEIKPYPEYEQLSMERVNSEFIRILKSKKAAEIIRELHRTGLLGYIIPEFEEAWGFNQNSHYHSMNLTDHSLSVMDNMRKTGEVFRMAALLHDISKYQKFEVKDNGEFSYHGHDKESAKMSVQILKRLKWSSEDIERVEKMISCHMILKPFKDPVTGLYNGSAKVTRRIVRELGDEMDACLDLIDADNVSHSPQYNMPLQVTSFYNALSKLVKVPIVRSCPVSGDLIMEKFGLKPGPVIKEVKEIMLDWLDENPELKEGELLDKFEGEYGGKGLWVWKESRDIFALTLTEPMKGMDGEITTRPYEYPYTIEKGGVELKDWKEWWNAIEHPKIYSAVMRSKLARSIFDQAADILAGLEKIPGFRQVRMELDSYNDLSGTIEWEDLKPDYIL